MFYLKRPIGIVHLVRLILLIVLIILIELKYSQCSFESLNDYLGYSHWSILFFYIVIWIAFSFEIYFLLNRFVGHPKFVARRSTMILYIFLLICFLLGSSLTLVAWRNSFDGYLITQNDETPSASRNLPVNSTCNDLRWIPISFGYAISLLNSLTILFLMCYED